MQKISPCLWFDGKAEEAMNFYCSVFVKCKTQQEVDALWDKLLEGGQAQQCGWLTDKYGVSWQIVPTVLGEMLQDPDPKKSKRVMEAMMGMVRLDIERLKRAYDRP